MAKVADKMRKLVLGGYLAVRFVLALTPLFSFLKGIEDIHMFFGVTFSGLNGILYAPKCMLP